MQKLNINGLLLLNKPSGISSNTALQIAKRLFNAKKAGHTGTLDPSATGLLPICFGEATKFSTFLLNSNKEYIATIKLGNATTTYDIEGEITHTAEVSVSHDEVSNAINFFLGEQSQTPPIYSALKVKGKALYEYARSGISVEIQSRKINIFKLELLQFLENNQFKLRVLCSKGTYIRSLANDIGIKLGCYAHLTELHRTKSNDFVINDILTLDYLERLSVEERNALLLPADTLVKDMPRIDLDQSQYDKIKFGNQFEYHGIYDINKQQFRAYYNNAFLGIVKIISYDKMQPVRLVDITFS
ncbi:MAG: tRNA pseudouridine(55) synthase TruB [Neisseriaceae bacterium]